MPPKKPTDEAALLKMAKDGIHQKEIMSQLGIKTGTQLKIAYINALMNNGDVPAIQSAPPGKTDKSKCIIKVNKRGSLIIPKPIVDQLGLQEGDAFDTTRTKTGLDMQATAPKPVVKLRKRQNRKT